MACWKAFTAATVSGRDAVTVEGVAVPEIPEVDLILDGPNGSRARNTFPAWLEGLREPLVISGPLALFRRQRRR